MRASASSNGDGSAIDGGAGPVVRFDHFEVDLERRILRRSGREVRLQEKPFRLLEALLERPGELVGREELYEILWPEAEHLDFEASLNVAARKLRQALGDSSREPRWLETVPRRGYRLRARAELVEGEGDGQRLPRVAVAAAVLLSLVVVATLLWSSRRPEEREERATIRLAIMPFELAATQESTRLDLARIGEWLLAETANRWRGRVEVIGPRTTAGYLGEPLPQLARMAEELHVDYVLNARAIEELRETAVLVELIRLSDGAHPWVEWFEDVGDWRAVAETIHGQVGAAIDPRPAAG